MSDYTRQTEQPRQNLPVVNSHVQFNYSSVLFDVLVKSKPPQWSIGPIIKSQPATKGKP